MTQNKGYRQYNWFVKGYARSKRGGSVYPSSVHKIATALGVEPSELVKAS